MAEEPRDTGTPELSRRRRVIPRLRAASGYSYDLYVADGSGPDRLLLAGKIDTNQHALLLSFTVLLHKARMLGPKGPAFERVSTSDPAAISTKMSEALRLVGRVNGYLDKAVGRKPRMGLVDLCMLDIAYDASAEHLAALREALDFAYS